jgi:hypothetical protein
MDRKDARENSNSAECDAFLYPEEKKRDGQHIVGTLR